MSQKQGISMSAALLSRPRPRSRRAADMLARPWYYHGTPAGHAHEIKCMLIEAALVRALTKMGGK